MEAMVVEFDTFDFGESAPHDRERTPHFASYSVEVGCSESCAPSSRTMMGGSNGRM